MHESQDLNTEFKKGDDPVTEADFKCQYVINSMLSTMAPGIFIVGEEGQNGLESKFDFDVSSLKCLGIPEFDNIEYPIEELIVFVDPLDGTRSFTKGNMESVTTLITLVHKNEPIAAAIGDPYETRTQFRPTVYIGARGLNKVIQFESKGFYEHEQIK